MNETLTWPGLKKKYKDRRKKGEATVFDGPVPDVKKYLNKNDSELLREMACAIYTNTQMSLLLMDKLEELQAQLK